MKKKINNMYLELKELLENLFNELKIYKHKEEKLNIFHEMYGATIYSLRIADKTEEENIKALWNEFYDKCNKEIEG